MAIPLVQLLEDPNDNESKLWGAIQGLRGAIGGTGGPLAGWPESSGVNGEGDAIVGAGNGPIGVNAPEGAFAEPQELTNLASANPLAVGRWSWSWVGPNREAYVFYTPTGSGYSASVNKLYHVVGTTFTEVPKVPPLDAINCTNTVSGESDEPAYFFFGGGFQNIYYVWKNKRVQFNLELFAGNLDGATDSWTKYGDRFYCFPQTGAGREIFREYDANVGGASLRTGTVLDGLAAFNGVISCQATQNYLWVMLGDGDLYQVARSDLSLVRTIPVTSASGLGSFHQWFRVMPDEATIYLARMSGAGGNHYELRVWKDGTFRDIDTFISTPVSWDPAFSPFVSFVRGEFYFSSSGSPGAYDIVGTLGAAGQSAASEILLLGEEGQITPDYLKIITIDTINHRIGINTGAPAATLDIFTVSQDGATLALHNTAPVLVDLFAGGSNFTNLRIRGDVTTSPATRFVFLTMDSGGALVERAFIDSDAGVGTLSANYGGFGRAITLESTTDVGYELASTRADADAVNIGSVSAQYRTNSAGHTRIAEIQFRSDGATANQRGGRIVLMTKANGSTTLSDRWAVTQAGVLQGLVSGGGTIIGGTASGDVLVLQGSAHANGGQITVNSDTIVNSSDFLSAVKCEPTFTGSNNGPQGLYIGPTFQPGASIGVAYGYLAIPVYDPATSKTISDAQCFLTRLKTGSGGGAITAMEGVYVDVSYGSVKPTTANAARLTNVGASGITDAIGLKVDGQSGATNNLGIRVDVGTIGNSSRALQIDSLQTGSSARPALAEIGGSISSSSANIAALFITTNFTGSGDGPLGCYSQPTFAPSANISACYGFLGDPIFAPPTGVTITTAIGAFARTLYTGSVGAVTNGIAFNTEAPTNLSGGTLKPTNQYGVVVRNQGLSGITTAVGIHIDKPTNATNNFYMGFDTGNTAAAGAYKGKIPIVVAGTLQYFHYFD